MKDILHSHILEMERLIVDSFDNSDLNAKIRVLQEYIVTPPDSITGVTANLFFSYIQRGVIFIQNERNQNICRIRPDNKQMKFEVSGKRYVIKPEMSIKGTELFDTETKMSIAQLETGVFSMIRNKSRFSYKGNDYIIQSPVMNLGSVKTIIDEDSNKIVGYIGLSGVFPWKAKVKADIVPFAKTWKCVLTDAIPTEVACYLVASSLVSISDQLGKEE